MSAWGEGWRWLLYGTLVVIVPFSSLFLVGLWVMRMTPCTWWRRVWAKDYTPVQYDGKEPYTQWATKMSQAREAQRHEDDT